MLIADPATNCLHLDNRPRWREERKPPYPATSLADVSSHQCHTSTWSPIIQPQSWFQFNVPKRTQMVLKVYSFASQVAVLMTDTNSNIKNTKEFCVSIISEPFLEASNYTSIDAPYDVDEWKLSGLTQRSSQ